MRAFDRDNDGRLSDDERAAMREQLGDRFIELRERIRELRDDRGDDADRDGARRRTRWRPRPRCPTDAERERRGKATADPKPAAMPATSHGPKRVAMQSHVATGSTTRRRVREERRIRVELRDGPEGRLGPDGPGTTGPLGGPPERNIQALVRLVRYRRRQHAQSPRVRRAFPVRRTTPSRSAWWPSGPGSSRPSRSVRPARVTVSEIRPLRARANDWSSDARRRTAAETTARSVAADRVDPPRPPRPDGPPGPPPASEPKPSDAI